MRGPTWTVSVPGAVSIDDSKCELAAERLPFGLALELSAFWFNRSTLHRADILSLAGCFGLPTQKPVAP